MNAVKYELEYTLKTTEKIVYQRLSTPGGLSEWFADKVIYSNKNLVFEWNGSEQKAKILSKKANNHIRLKWLDDESEDTYFEFRINKGELTGEISLIITDFALEDEIDENTELWNQQIGDLKRAIGL